MKTRCSTGTTFKLMAIAVLAAALPALGRSKPSGGGGASDIPVTTYVSDVNLTTGTPYYIQSDDKGQQTGLAADEYQNGVSNAISILVANGYNGFADGDWRLDLSTNSSTRQVGIYLGTENEILPGTATPNPPYWGEAWQQVRMENKCTFENKDMLTMVAGDSFTCPMEVRLAHVYDPARGSNYRLGMAPTVYNYTETQDVHVQCNSVIATDGKCNDWFIDPIPVTNSDGTTSPGRTEARLSLISTHGANNDSDEGDFYLTFHIEVKR